jgi:hypothetical protein
MEVCADSLFFFFRQSISSWRALPLIEVWRTSDAEIPIDVSELTPYGNEYTNQYARF